MHYLKQPILPKLKNCCQSQTLSLYYLYGITAPPPFIAIVHLPPRRMTRERSDCSSIGPRKDFDVMETDFENGYIIAITVVPAPNPSANTSAFFDTTQNARQSSPPLSVYSDSAATGNLYCAL